MEPVAEGNEQQEKQQEEIFDSKNRSPARVKFSEKSRTSSQGQNSNNQDDLSSGSRQGLY